MIQAPADVTTILNAKPGHVFIADLFTFQTVTGTTYRYTNTPRPVIAGGTTWPVSSAKLSRGRINLSRGVAVDSHQVRVVEKNAAILESIMLGYFNLATYTLQRSFAISPTSPWSTPLTRYIGQVAQIDEIGYSYAKITVKSMLNLLDNDFPRILIQAQCGNVLFSPGCGLSRARYLVSGSVGAGSTGNTIKTALSQAAGYFTQGIITFTSGALAGISYYIKTHVAGGTLYPAYPLLTAPAAGDTFTVSPGCDKTLATCRSKYGYAPLTGSAPFYRGQPFVPDPVTTY